MKEVAQLIHDRLTGDTSGTDNLESLLGASGRIYRGFQSQQIQDNSLVYWIFTATPNQLGGDRVKILEEFWQFSVFSGRHMEILTRIRRLFDDRRFTIPSSYNEIGSLSSVWEWEGPPTFDENLKTGRRDVMLRFFVGPKAVDPI